MFDVRNNILYNIFMNPVILAAGKGERYEGDTIKPLMVVKGRPVLFDALYTLGKMGFASREINIVVNSENRTAIKRAIGDSAIKLVLQQDLSGPSTAVKAVFDNDPKHRELLVVQADDAAWFDPILQDFARYHERRRPEASMALLATGDPGVHHSTYEVSTDGMITGYRAGLPEHKHMGQGCNAGVYIVNRSSFMAAYRTVGPPNNSDVGLPTVINDLIDNGLPVAGPVYEIPWKSANTVAGLAVARSLVASAGNFQDMIESAQLMADATKSS
jgi:dTDP-glucose pyrophosphorylase